MAANDNVQAAPKEEKKPVEGKPVPAPPGSVFVVEPPPPRLELEVLDPPNSFHDSASDPEMDQKYLKKAKKRMTKLRKKKIKDLNARRRHSSDTDEDPSNQPPHATRGLPNIPNAAHVPDEPARSWCYQWCQKICCCDCKRHVEC